MHRWIAGAAALIAVGAGSTAEAEDLAGFVALAEQKYALCLDVYNRGIERGDLRFAGTNCTYQVKGELSPVYKVARGELAKRPAALSRLNDYYATWVAGLDGMEPSPGESRLTYSARQASAFQELRKLGARLALE